MLQYLLHSRARVRQTRLTVQGPCQTLRNALCSQAKGPCCVLCDSVGLHRTETQTQSTPATHALWMSGGPIISNNTTSNTQ